MTDTVTITLDRKQAKQWLEHRHSGIEFAINDAVRAALDTTSPEQSSCYRNGDGKPHDEAFRCAACERRVCGYCAEPVGNEWLCPECPVDPKNPAPEQSHVSSVLGDEDRDRLREIAYGLETGYFYNPVREVVEFGLSAADFLRKVSVYKLAEHPSSGAECESCDDTGIYEEGSEWAPCGECDLGRRWAELLKTAREEAVAQGSGDSTESTKPETKGGTDG